MGVPDSLSKSAGHGERGKPVVLRLTTIDPRQRRAVGRALATALLLMVMIAIGSRGLRDGDSALIGFARGSVFAFAGFVERSTLRLIRPPAERCAG